MMAGDVFAIGRSIKGSVYKLNLVCGLIRNLSASDASVQLLFCKRRVAFDLKKVLMSAIANAQNNFSYDVDRLYVSSVIVGKNKVLKRLHPRARGRGARILKHYSDVKIVLSLR